MLKIEIILAHLAFAGWIWTMGGKETAMAVLAQAVLWAFLPVTAALSFKYGMLSGMVIVLLGITFIEMSIIDVFLLTAEIALGGLPIIIMSIIQIIREK